jgi:hypothetical protein
MWLLLPVLTPVMVIAAALASQRFERIVLTPNPAILLDSGSATNQHTPEVRGDR